MRFVTRRPSFGQGWAAKAEDAPATLSRRDVVRRQAMLADAKAVIPHLPQPGECLHGIMTGRYDLMHLLLAVLDGRPPVDALRIATLSFNAANVAEMTHLLDSGRVKSLLLLCSTFFKEHSAPTYTQCLNEFASRGARLAHSRNHCKVVTMAFEGGAKLVLEGSANLRSNSNREQFLLANDAQLHDWHAAWIETEAQGHESHASGH